MGVDVSLKVKFLDKKNKEKYEIKVSDQDNTLESLFQSCGMESCLLRYTNIIVDRKNILSEKENQMFSLQNIEDMYMETEIIPAKEAFPVLEKLYWQIDLVSRKTVIQDLNVFNKMDGNEDLKIQRKISIYREYSGFNHSFSTLLGIVKTAADMNYNIQIAAEYY